MVVATPERTADILVGDDRYRFSCRDGDLGGLLLFDLSISRRHFLAFLLSDQIPGRLFLALEVGSRTPRRFIPRLELDVFDELGGASNSHTINGNNGLRPVPANCDREFQSPYSMATKHTPTSQKPTRTIHASNPNCANPGRAWAGQIDFDQNMTRKKVEVKTRPVTKVLENIEYYGHNALHGDKWCIYNVPHFTDPLDGISHNL